MTILEKTIQILRDEERRAISKPSGPPKTVEDAVNRLVIEMALKDKTTLANMEETDLVKLHFSLGIHIRNKYLYPQNDKLLQSCRQKALDKYLHWDQASMVIIKELWRRLRKSHKLRIVK